MRYKLAQTEQGLNHYVHDIPEPEGPLLDEVEFAKLCYRVVNMLTLNAAPPEGYPYDGCYTAILGPPGIPSFPTFEDGHYTDLSVREAKMMATIIVEQLGLVYDPDNYRFAWAEVATGRFLVSSRNDGVIVPSPYPQSFRDWPG